VTCFLPQRCLQAAAGPVLALALAVATAAPAAAATGPTPTKRPHVAGDAVEGARLAVSHGAWNAQGTVTYTYRWYRCDTMGRHCVVLQGDDARSHKVLANDVGHTLSAAVRATDGGGSTLAFASLVGPIGGAPPKFDALAQPAIAGNAVQGATLHVGTGRWKPQPSGFAYQWARCNADLRACAPIKGQTGTTYAIVPADLGHALVAIVQARSGAVSRAVFSTASAVTVATGTAAPAPTPAPKPAPKPVATATGAGPKPSTPPSVAEVLQQGSVLTGSVGTWSGSGAISFHYDWYRCDATGSHCTTVVRDATRPTYLLGAKDVGQTLGFAVHATDGKGTTIAYAALIGPIAAPSASLFSTGPPAVTGSAAIGQALQVSTGAWSQAPSSLGYQWEQCNAHGRLCTPISGATSSTYTVATADGGHRLLAVVHATAGAAAQDVLSAATPAIAAAPLATSSTGPTPTAGPTVAGTAAQGSQLTASTGTWSGSGTISYSFNWYRCDTAGAHCLSIHGATKATYTETATDVGHTLGVAVHATDSGGLTIAYGSLVGPVAASNAGLASTTQPTIAGTAAPGQTLTTSTGGWTQTPTAVTYQWLRCNANGRLCAVISGATGVAYTTTTDDSGHTLVVVVTGTLNAVQQAAFSMHSGAIS
jgi:Ig domain of plant-specific actin-binding protein